MIQTATPAPSPSPLTAVSLGLNTIPLAGVRDGQARPRRSPGRVGREDGGMVVLGVRRNPPHLAADMEVNLRHPDRRRRLAAIDRLMRGFRQQDGLEPTRTQRRQLAQVRARRAEGAGESRTLEPSAPFLEPLDNEVEGYGCVREVVRVSAVRCRRQVCECCGRIIGYGARHSLIARELELRQEHGAGDVQMWTLTVDPSRYESPEAAWLDVGKRRRVGETMRKMGLRWYVVVLEWHASGWPHWHVLVWEPVARMRVEHSQMERAWGLGWTIYRCRYRDGHGRLMGKPKPVEWAIRYVTKYLVKPKGESVPAWAMDRSRVRMIWSSRAWGPVVDRLDDCECESETTGTVHRSSARSNRDALAMCGQTVRVLRRVVDLRTGEERWRYVGDSAVPWRVARRLGERLAGIPRSSRSWMDLREPGSMERIIGALKPGCGTVPRPMLD